MNIGRDDIIVISYVSLVSPAQLNPYSSPRDYKP